MLHSIEGRVHGASAGQKIVLFARSGVWWVQPLGDKPFTTIERDSTWKNSTHPGSDYAALLVDASYRPPLTANVLPGKGGAVHAVAASAGAASANPASAKLNFSGYDWVARSTPGTPAGTPNLYDPANAWVDREGYLHLRIAKTPQGWTSAELRLARSLGYGSYRFVVRDVSSLQPAAVLSISTWDASSAYREMDIEIGRWGEASGKNAQYVIQPYYVPANVMRFLAPPGRLTYSFDWEPGRVAFHTFQGAGSSGSEIPGSHVFTSGVPIAGNEVVRLNLYVFEERRAPLQGPAEVIFEKFEYLP